MSPHEYFYIRSVVQIYNFFDSYNTLLSYHVLLYTVLTIK